jgi:hypothetical protein
MAVVVGRFELMFGVVGIDLLLAKPHDLLNQPLGFSEMADEFLNRIDRDEPLEVMEFSLIVVSDEGGDSGVDSRLSFRGVALGARGLSLISDRQGRSFAERLLSFSRRGWDSFFGRGRFLRGGGFRSVGLSDLEVEEPV